MSQAQDQAPAGGLDDQKQQLAEDFKKIIADAEQLLGSLSGAPEQAAGEVKQRLEKDLTEAKEKLQALEHKLAQAAERAGQWTQENPLAALGLSFGAGMLFTLLFLERRG